MFRLRGKRRTESNGEADCPPDLPVSETLFGQGNRIRDLICAQNRIQSPIEAVKAVLVSDFLFQFNELEDPCRKRNAHIPRCRTY